MIQRIQSIYLAVIALCCGLVFVFPFAEIVIPDGVCVLDALSITTKTQIEVELLKPWLVTILAILCALLSVAIVMQFKNRLLQIKLCRFNMLLLLGLIISIFYMIDRTQELLSMGADAEISYGLGSFLPLVAVILNILAIRAITKDERLVRSADRLR
ncbi:MAG: hypothetical protein COB85_02760 [Bacteroidetes bacterium]|nr:MAG: hypothetical protein COB85_02760 [Bacteroidota bacterium]